MMAQQSQVEFQKAQTAALQGQAAESQARAGKYVIETQLAPEELEIEKIEAITRNLKDGDGDDKEFERRLKVAEVALKEKALSNRGATPRADDTNRDDPVSRSNQPSVQRPVQPIRPVGGQGQGPRGPNVGPAPEGGA